MGNVADNLARVRDAMARAAERSGRKAEEIKLVAVSKTKPVDLIREAVEAGQRDFGENYAQELRDKMKEISDLGIRWHFIGKLQKNKVKYVAGKTWAVHTLDNVSLAEEIAGRSEREGVITRVLIEVNVGGESSKVGVNPSATLDLVGSVRELKSLELVGLMTMPPYWEDAEAARPSFIALRELRDRARKEFSDPAMLPELSMGLSHDFEVAIEEGATMVRVGTAIFGARNY
jgi:PLP dependent protein